MPIHERILQAALRICRERGGWTFEPREVVAALADLNPGSVRTHVMSRCCVNAPAHHAHRWPYFRRVRRGLYEIAPAWRRRKGRGPSEVAGPSGRDRTAAAAGILVEVRQSGAGYVAEIPGRAGKFRSTSLDDVAAQVRKAGQRAGTAISTAPAPLQMRVDFEPERADPVIAAYEKDIDRTLIRRRLRLGFQERLLALERWTKDIEELRSAARHPRRRTAK